MSEFWKQLLIFLGIAIVAYTIVYFTKSFFYKKKIKKKYVLISMAVFILLPIATYTINNKYLWLQYIETLVIYYFMFLYIDFARIERIKRNAPVIGRPKPKKNRVKEK